MLPRMALAACLAVAGLVATAAPAAAYEDLCVSHIGGQDEPILPFGIRKPYQVCVPVFVDIPPAP